MNHEAIHVATVGALISAIMFALVFLLTGCDTSAKSEELPPSDDHLSARFVKTPSGERVLCITRPHGGLSCDWSGKH